jgi:hypothetical protein
MAGVEIIQVTRTTQSHRELALREMDQLEALMSSRQSLWVGSEFVLPSLPIDHKSKSGFCVASLDSPDAVVAER